uniref:Uncharacterized protein n=1 Tax=Timema monikensis TaxID=170555 RepID=A0A7R9EI40_9NEOP|nr:unnamed protein product [Timema monikensis]
MLSRYSLYLAGSFLNAINNPNLHHKASAWLGHAIISTTPSSNHSHWLSRVKIAYTIRRIISTSLFHHIDKKYGSAGPGNTVYSEGNMQETTMSSKRIIYCVHGKPNGCCVVTEEEITDKTNGDTTNELVNVLRVEHCHRTRGEGLDTRARRKLILASIICVIFMLGEVVVYDIGIESVEVAAQRLQVRIQMRQRVTSYPAFCLISQEESVKMFRVEREIDVLSELNEDGRSPGELTSWLLFSGNTSVI